MKELIIPLLLWVAFQGNTATECNMYKETAIQCKFTKDLFSTKTDFAVYFFPNNGKAELLTDCGWMEDQLECIEQKGIEIKQPVSNIVEIILPTRFHNKTGSYKCVPEDYSTADSKPCQFVKNQQKDKTELVEDSGDKSHHDQNAGDAISISTIIAITGSVVGTATIAIVSVILVKRWKKRSSSKRRSEKSCQTSKTEVSDLESRLTDGSSPLSSIDSREVKLLVTCDK